MLQLSDAADDAIGSCGSDTGVVQERSLVHVCFWHISIFAPRVVDVTAEAELLFVQSKAWAQYCMYSKRGAGALIWAQRSLEAKQKQCKEKLWKCFFLPTF